MKILAAPIHLDALVLPHATVVKDALADYSRLPFTDKSRDYHPDTPYVSEAILNHPFQDKNLTLSAGVHLHWSFPKGLTKTIGEPLIKKTDLDELKPYFPKNIIKKESSWEQTKNDIWNTVLNKSGWTKPVGKNRASVLPMDKRKQADFNKRLETLARQVGWTQDEVIKFVEELMKFMSKPLGSDYPGVPDTWLINRKQNGGDLKTWIVESHYIATAQSDQDGNLSAVTVPFHDDRHDNKTQPFRYMGRQLEVGGNTNWRSGNLKDENYLQEITAVGYNPQPGTKGFAEPTFAAFYPNCMSVFGFYDPDLDVLLQPEQFVYEVLGLYANPENDYLKIFLNDFSNRYRNSFPKDKDKDYFNYLNEVLASEFLWKTAENTPINSDASTPEQAVLFGKAVPKEAHTPDASKVDIAIGNTGTEALSAYLAAKVSENKKKSEEKKKLEEILESIQFSSRLNNKVLDIGHKFQEARHDKGFTAFPGGTLWSIKLETEEAQSAAESNETNQQELTLPDRLAVLLNETNALQFAYDRAWREIPYLRRQLFSDWYKYMVSAYPPVEHKSGFFETDEVLNYIRNESMPLLNEKLSFLGSISIATDDQGRFKEAKTSDNADSIAGQLVARLQQLAGAVRDFNDTDRADGKSLKDQGKCLALRQVPAPRYWRANDPVILFAEKATRKQKSALKNDRHATPGISGPVECKLVDVSLTNPADFSFDKGMELFQQISLKFAGIKETGNAESKAIWNPFIMEWKVEFLPAMPGSNGETNNRLYDYEYINRHYRLQETDPDLSLTASTNVFSNANPYSGSTLLTPNARTRLERAIRQFVDDHKESQKLESLQMLDDAQKELEKINVLSQSLGGFHEALLMQKQTRQLDIADPLGFPAYQAFAEDEVAPLVQKHNLTAPQPLTKFNPIRSGRLKILNLRLIDSFGQTVDFDSRAIVAASETLTVSGKLSGVHLQPRLSQPARLNFRFLSATAGEQEMNAHPASSPVCGWLLPNNLDRSIMFYDQDGSALGALTINASNPWRPAPDSTTTTFIDSIGNLHLRRVARHLFNRQQERLEAGQSRVDSFLHHFLNALDNAQENIDPENFAEHQDLAVLMGKPVAVVRAKFNLELEGPPATDQSWTQLHHELQGHGRSTDDFTKVKFPLRLGEYKQLNDGLVGYWIETREGQLGEDYFSSEAGENSGNPDPHIKIYVPGEPLNILHAIDDDPVCVTMLADPKGSIHMTSGILPVKSISIPKDQYKDALKRIAVTFLTAPVLSTENHLKISVPKESGYEWTWLEKTEDRQWQEIPQTVLIEKSVFDAKFPDQPTLWDQLVTQKWLQLLQDDPERALVTTAVHRAFPPNTQGEAHPFPVDIGKRLDNFFDTYGKRIEPFDFHVSFGGPQVIREGWLRLGEVQQAATPKEDTVSR